MSFSLDPSLQFYFFPAYLIIGIFSGFAAGLLGIGGGSISVPALLLLFSFSGLPHSNLMHYAIGTSLATTCLNCISAAYFHSKNKTVLWTVVKKNLPGVIVGSLTGALVAQKLSTSFLEILFGIFACLIAAHLARPTKNLNQTKSHPPKAYLFNAISSIVAFIANILGVGGGVFMVPLLSFFHFETKKAIGTSVALSFIISLVGAIGYLLAYNSPTHVPYTLGYIYIPAFIVIGFSSIFSSYYGAKLVQKMPTRTLRKVFSLCLLAIGLTVLFA